MNQGRLNKRVQFQVLKDLRNAKGQKLRDEWKPLFSAWAEIKQTTVNENETSNRIKTTVKTSIKIHFREGVNSTLRIIRGNRIFHIEGVINEREENRYLICECEEQR